MGKEVRIKLWKGIFFPFKISKHPDLKREFQDIENNNNEIFKVKDFGKTIQNIVTVSVTDMSDLIRLITRLSAKFKKLKFEIIGEWHYFLKNGELIAMGFDGSRNETDINEIRNFVNFTSLLKIRYIKLFDVILKEPRWFISNNEKDIIITIEGKKVNIPISEIYRMSAFRYVNFLEIEKLDGAFSINFGMIKNKQAQLLERFFYETGQNYILIGNNNVHRQSV